MGPIADSALLSARLVKDVALKVYPGALHGLTSTHKEQFNADLLSFLKSWYTALVIQGVFEGNQALLQRVNSRLGAISEVEL